MSNLRAVVCVVTATALLATPAIAQENVPPLKTWTIDEDTTVGIAHFDDIRMDVMMVIDNDELVWSQGGYLLEMGDDFNTPVKTGTDITGDGIANMVVLEFSGGAHCCSTYYLYAFDPYFRQIAAIDTQDSGARFVPHSGVPGLVMITGDNTFAYWNTYYAASPAPEVKLVWDGTAYAFSSHLMTSPAPAADTLKQQAASIAASDQWTDTDMDPDLWREMLDLIYSGNAGLAWTFLDDGWPAGRDGKAAFKTNFRCQLAQSPWWDDVAAMNKLDPADIPADCSGNTGG